MARRRGVVVLVAVSAAVMIGCALGAEPTASPPAPAVDPAALVEGCRPFCGHLDPASAPTDPPAPDAAAVAAPAAPGEAAAPAPTAGAGRSGATGGSGYDPVHQPNVIQRPGDPGYLRGGEVRSGPVPPEVQARLPDPITSEAIRQGPPVIAHPPTPTNPPTVTVPPPPPTTAP